MTKQTSQNNSNSDNDDMIFYTVITALSIGLTSLCIYSYRKYKKYYPSLNEEEYYRGPARAPTQEDDIDRDF